MELVCIFFNLWMLLPGSERERLVLTFTHASIAIQAKLVEPLANSSVSKQYGLSKSKLVRDAVIAELELVISKVVTHLLDLILYVIIVMK